MFLAVSCSGLFLFYFVAQRMAAAIAIFAVSAGYQALSYSHYFRGGWEEAGNTQPFNEEFIFATIVLWLTATSFGLAAWLLHHRLQIFGTGARAKLKVFAFAVGAFVVLAGVLIALVPLSFDRPIDIKLCDNTIQKPEYCP